MSLPEKVTLTPDLLNTVKNHGVASIEEAGQSWNIFHVDGQNYIVERKLGAGKQGYVFKVFPISNQGSIDLSHPVALKFCFFNKNKDQQPKQLYLLNLEIKILKAAHYQDISQLNIYTLPHGQQYASFTMEYFDGKPLSDEETQEELRKLTFTERVQLIVQGAMLLSQLHNARKTHAPFVLADIKPENILLCIKIINGRPVVRLIIIDFGLAYEMVDGELHKINNPRGTLITLAPELYLAKCGTKSDVYSFVSIVLMLLGVADPFFDIENHDAAHDQLTYSMSGFLDNLNLPEADKDATFTVRILITKFVFRMMERSYFARTSTNEVLAFFNYLYQTCLLFQKIHTIKNLTVDTLTEHDINLLQTLYAEQFISLTEVQCALINRLTSEQINAMLAVPVGKLDECLTIIRGLYNPYSAAGLLKKPVIKPDVALLRKLKPLQIKTLAETIIEPDVIKIFESLTLGQREQLRTLGPAQAQLLNLSNEYSSLFQLSVAERVILQEVVNRFSNSQPMRVSTINKEEVTDMLAITKKETETEAAILLTKMAVLTAKYSAHISNKNDAIRLKLCQQYSFHNNHDICHLLLFLAAVGSKRFLIDYNNFANVLDTLDSFNSNQHLSLNFIFLLSTAKKDHPIINALLILKNINCLNTSFIKLFNRNNKFTMEVAEKIIELKNNKNLNIVKNNLSQLNDLLNAVMSTPSRSTFFETELLERMQEQVLTLLSSPQYELQMTQRTVQSKQA